MIPVAALQYAPFIISLFSHHHTPAEVTPTQVAAHAATAGLPAGAVAAVGQVIQQPGGALSLAQILTGMFSSQTPVSPAQFGAAILSTVGVGEGIQLGPPGVPPIMVKPPTQ